VIAAGFAVILLNNPAKAGQVSIDLSFPPPTVEPVQGYHRVTLPGALNVDRAGTPSLPSVGVWLLLPPGEMAVSCELKELSWKRLPGHYQVEPTPPPHRLSDPSPPPTEPDPSIYNGQAAYPPEPVTSLRTHLKRGYALATCLSRPVRWNPADGTLEYLTEAELTLQTAPGDREMTGFNRFYRGDRYTRQWVVDRVRNPESLGLYPRRDQGDPEAMLVVTDSDFIDQAEEYAAWRNVRGLRTYVATCRQFIDQGDDDDHRVCIRNGITAAYEEWNISYVLLLGDDEQIPHRGLYGIVNNNPDRDIAADLYYAGLDGNWNDDDDDRWGEANEADLMAELFVGRIPAGDTLEAERSLAKVRLYSDEPVSGDVLKVLMVGENLDWNVMGGDYMDEVYEGSERWGYSTVGYPDRFQRRNLYDRDGGWNARNDLVPLISSGYHFIHHLGHANTRGVMKLKFNDLDDNLIANNGQENGFNIAWSQGCYAGSFDNRGVGPNQYIGDCVAEKFVSKLDHGLVAFVCNSRYGWGNGNNTNGASQHFHREFVDALFDEDITAIGATNQDSKEDTAPWADLGVIRFCYYEINLLGDPAMDIWTDEPVQVEAEFSNAVVIGDLRYEVTLEDVPGATVCLSRSSEIISVAVTDDDGVAVLDLPEPILPPGPVTLAIVAHNFQPLITEIQSIPSDVGYPWVEELIMEDLGGIEDGQADPGETVEISPSVHNLGRQALEGLTLSIEIDDPQAQIIHSETGFQTIEPDSELIPDQPLVIEIDTTCGDLHRVELLVSFEDDSGGSWTQNVVFHTHAPVLDGRFLTVLDEEGNNNGRLDPGEEADLLLSIVNSGTGRTADITAELATGNPDLEVLESQSDIDIIEPHARVDFEQLFRVRVAEDCPDPYRAVLYVRLSGERGVNRSYLSDLCIGGAYYSFDRELEPWEHENLNVDHRDQWHESDQDNHTFDGSRCLKVGSEELYEEYEPLLNCAVYMPSYRVNGPLQLVFWHRIDAEKSRAHPGRAYDGGFVEASTDGEEWGLILPETPSGRQYPYTISHGDSPNPLPVEQPCYSGQRDWVPAVFDLSGFEEQDIRIRFRFGSDGTENFTGWWIDDIELRLPVDLEPPDNLEGEMTGPGAFLTWSTPVITRDDDYVYPDELLGYRIYRGYIENQDWVMLDTLVTDNRYLDRLVHQPGGEYMYLVTAEYLTGESSSSNAITIEWTNAVHFEAQDAPDRWELSSAWPNPFNSLVRIAYTVPATGKVRIAVYDLNGRLVSELDRGLRLPGRYEVLFEAGHLPSGVYIVGMQTPAGIRVSRLVLLR